MATITGTEATDVPDDAAPGDRSRARQIAGEMKGRLRRRLDVALAGAGYELRLLGPDEIDARRMRLMDSLAIDLVLDVGANAGQYAQGLREAGFAGRIVSFEPLSEAFANLERHAVPDRSWEVHHRALGDEDGTAPINVAGNSWSSSLLPMGSRHLASAPESAYVDIEEVALSRLDSLWDEVVRPGERVWLKLDVQGFEGRVLRGAEGCQRSLAAVQLEMSLVPLYEGEDTWRELVDYLEEAGFELGGLEPGFSDPISGRLLQFDGIFIREG